MTAFGAVPWLKCTAHGVGILRYVSCLELGSVGQRCCLLFWCTVKSVLHVAQIQGLKSCSVHLRVFVDIWNESLSFLLIYLIAAPSLLESCHDNDFLPGWGCFFSTGRSALNIWCNPADPCSIQQTCFRILSRHSNSSRTLMQTPSLSSCPHTLIHRSCKNNWLCLNLNSCFLLHVSKFRSSPKALFWEVEMLGAWLFGPECSKCAEVWPK